MAFVFEQRRELNARMHFPEQFWNARDTAIGTLAAFERSRISSFPLSTAKITLDKLPSQDSQLTHMCKRYLAPTEGPHDQVSVAFLKAFVAHVLLLETLSIEERAQPLAPLHDAMLRLLTEFLPKIFLILEYIVRETGWKLDLDSKLFVRLLHILWLHPGASFSQVVGDGVSSRVDAIWAPLEVGTVNFSIFASEFGTTEELVVPTPTHNALRVLPFENPILDEQLSVVQVRVESTGDITVPTGHLEFGDGIVVADTRHWHNQKRALLPKHLGGEDAAPKDARARFRELRRQQRFMASLQKQATTLTGALGAPLEQQVIVAVGTSKPNAKARAQGAVHVSFTLVK